MVRVCNQIEPLKIASYEFKPLGSQFLGKYDERTESDGGILYPKPDNTWWAKVIVAGPDCTVKKGEQVLMSQYRGENINFLDGEFSILNETDGLAVKER